MRASQCLWQNHYQVLGLKVNASAKEIKKQFYMLSKKYHPDANQDADPAKYQQITQAYTVLSNQAKRKEFDASLGAAVRQPQGYTGRRTSWSGTQRAQSGFRFHDKWAARAAHSTRRDPSLDPLRPNGHRHGPNGVPHFDYAKHYAQQQRQDQYRERHRRTSEDTAPANQSNSFKWVCTGIAGSLAMSYLLLR